MDDFVTITINGEVWHVPSNQYQYLKVVGNHLVNTSSNTIILYKNWYEVNTNNNYPNIYCQGGGACYLRSGTGVSSNYSTINVSSYEWSIPYDLRDYGLVSVFFICIIALSVFTTIFRRRHI